MTAMNVMVGLTHMVCGQCGVHFAMDETFRQECEDTGKGWYCPNGHSRVYKTPEVVRLRTELEKAQRAAIQARDAATYNDRERAKAEAKVARLLKRAKAGTCPMECRRSFTNLRRHVETKHPEIASAIRLAEAKSK